MSLSSRKIGFWSVFELVTISQIGSGLMLPAQLAAFGTLSLVGWGISGLGALILAVVFAELCVRNPKMGGPHVYVNETFGPTAAFFTGWAYWVASWVSTVAIITSAVGYISPLLGDPSSDMTLVIEIAIITWATFINFNGTNKASKTKLSTIIIKLVPLILVPVIALFFFDKSNFATLDTYTSNLDGVSPLNNVILITLWGFIGFESATATADKILQPSKTIRYAIILGTLFVAAVYFTSSLGIMGIIPGQTLMNSKAPYADAAYIMGGMGGYVFISLVCALICLGAVNAWTLASGHIALGVTQDRLLPKFFAKTNKHGAPIAALLISWLGTILILILIHKESLAQQINTIIDLSVITFLYIYGICCLAYLKILYLSRKKAPIWQWGTGLVSLGFCAWIIASTDIATLLIASLFVLSGLPIFLLRFKKIIKSGLSAPA
jgi:APA family basic amino acid/polyamine antiporter